MKGYLLKCRQCRWEWGVGIGEAARFDRLFLHCPKCKGRDAETVRTFDYELPWPVTDAGRIVDGLAVDAAALWRLYHCNPDPVGRLAESLLQNGQGLESGGPLTPEHARLVAETAWRWARAKEGATP